MNLIFDFDGTLCDSLDVTIEIINKYLGLFGLAPTTAAEFRELGLHGLMTSRSIPQFTAYLIGPLAHWEYRRRLPHMRLFPWTPNVISQLGTSHTLGILTNNSVSVVGSLLSQLNLNPHFQFITSESSIFNKKTSLQKIISAHNLAIPDTYYIGDALRDIQAAHLLGLKSIGVTWGLESDELLASAHPTHLVTTPESLLQLFTS